MKPSMLAHDSRIFRKFSLAGLLLFLVLTAGTVHGAITFIYPADKSVVARSDYLILKLNNPEITGVKVTVNGLESDMLLTGAAEYRKAFRDFLILQATWDPGKNLIKVDGFNDGKPIEAAAAEILFQPKKEEAAPPGYSPNPFHTLDKEKYCSPCHNMNPTGVQMEEGVGKANPCYGCHSKMINYTFVHGPTGTFTCNFCHDGKENPRYVVSRRGAQLCGECHAEQVEYLKKRKFQHGPVEAGMCEICHDPHGSQFPAQLRAPINVLCLSCHEEVGRSVHVIATPGGAGHPLSDVPDPSRPGAGRTMSCVSCHEPHAADVRFYFQNNAAVGMAVCIMCHNK